MEQLGRRCWSSELRVAFFSCCFPNGNISLVLFTNFQLLSLRKQQPIHIFEGSFEALSRGFGDESLYWTPREGLPSSEAKKSS